MTMMEKDPSGTGEVPPLRRATYTSIDKLVLSQYDVDMKKLESELSKLRTGISSLKEDTDATDIAGSGGEPQDNITPIGEEKVESPPKNSPPRAWTGNDPSNPLISVFPDSGSVSVGSSQPQLQQNKYPHLNRLQPPRDGFNLCVLVGKVEVVVDKFRVDGTRVLVAEVEVGDETGSISVRARDEQIDMLRQVSEDGGAVVLRNCTMELYQGRHLRLAVSKWGKMGVYPDGIASTPKPPKSLNRELNFSLIDLNTIATSKVIVEPLHSPITSGAKGRKQHHQPQPKYASFKVEDDSNSRNSRQRPKRYQYQRKKNQHHPHNAQPMSPPSPLNPQHLYHTRGSDPSIAGGLPSHMHYSQYGSGASVDTTYSNQYQSPDHGGPHRQFLPNDHYKRQQELLYQQYELQQRHAHQMHMLQQQQETQRRILEHQQHMVPGINRVESHGSSGEYSVGGMAPNLQLGNFPHSSPSMPPAQTPMGIGGGPDYQFSLQGAGGGEGQQPQNFVPSYDSHYQLSTATIISPPMSPQHFGQQGPSHTTQEGRRQYGGSANQERQFNTGQK